MSDLKTGGKRELTESELQAQKEKWSGLLGIPLNETVITHAKISDNEHIYFKQSSVSEYASIAKCEEGFPQQIQLVTSSILQSISVPLQRVLGPTVLIPLVSDQVFNKINPFNKIEVLAK